MRHLDRFRDIADAYDGFVVDLWGVVHDGVHALPGSADCLRALRAAGKRVVLLSNAPRRAAAAGAMLARMGIDASLHDGLATSGEITRSLLLDGSHPFLASLGSRVFHLGPSRDRNVVEGVPVTLVATVEEADWVLNTGPDDEWPPGVDALAEVPPLLDRMAARRLPMVCANPDLEVIRGGVRLICAGWLARLYEDRGGRVARIGKPDAAVYAPVMARLGTPPARTAAVGDALATDMAGAKAAGIDGIWVLGGIHAALRGDADAADRAAREARLAPVATVPGFVW